MLETIFSMALSLFLLMDAIGNIPLYIAILKNCDPRKQKKIIIRELLIALAIIILFYFVGDFILVFLNVKQYTVMIAGGIILFLISLRMIFPSTSDTHSFGSHDNPLIVPLAIPLVAGPAVLAAVMLYSHQTSTMWVGVVAIFFAWAVTTLILVFSTYLQKILGKRGISALEKLMGLILTLIAVQMFLQGLMIYQRLS